MYKTTGFISFVLRRLTGVALVLYLFTHMWVIGSINQGPEVFNTRLNLVQTPFFKLAEIALLAAVVYHGLDGIRLLMVNWFKITEYRKSLFYAVLAVSVLIVIAGGIPILLFMLEKG
ncbi:MAG: succinate dehydrogenase, cytochrome b556 subunit [Chloroflexi bacterium]|jgi:succinate dehydrogenase / fumarate reductase cytochrome b subunit|nr:succinate dehydrogenase, cytochrome b556 subunit [Chloroflexota bacterium]